MVGALGPQRSVALATPPLAHDPPRCPARANTMNTGQQVYGIGLSRA